MTRHALDALATFNRWTRNRVGMCLWEVQEAYGTPHVFRNAISQWHGAQTKNPGDTNPLRGAPVFWDGGPGKHGHVAIYAGDGMVRSTDAGGPGLMGTKPLGWFQPAWYPNGEYLGWAEDIGGQAIPGLQPGPFVTEHVYTSKLGFGQRDSDTVKELQERLNRVTLTGGQTLPVTGNYLEETDQEVRLWQQQVCGDPPDPPGKSYLGPRQRAKMFPTPPYTIHDDGLPDIARPKVPEPPAGVMHGIDISSHQQGIDLAHVPAGFVVVKATEGATYTSPTLGEQYQGAKAAGRLLGLYHFARPDNNTGAAEADHFAGACKTLGAIGEAVLVLDWEREPMDNTAWVRAFVDRLIMVTGVTPLIYMSESVTRRADWSEFGDCPLWVAKYSLAEPNVSWPTPWVLWQWSRDWRAPGYAGPLDHNVSRVGAERWKTWATPM